MLSGLPDKPLGFPEIEALNQADALGFVFPVTPNSIEDDENGQPQIYDLLITTDDAIVAVGYNSGEGWDIIGRTDIESPKDEIVYDVIEYRGYEIEDEEKVLKFVTQLYEAIEKINSKN